MAIRFNITRGRRIHHRIAGSIESSGVPEEEEDDDKDIEGIVVYSLPSGGREMKRAKDEKTNQKIVFLFQSDNRTF